MKKLVLVLVTLFLLLPVSLMAKEGRTGDDNDRVRIEIKQEEVTAEPREQKVEIQGDRFEIRGMISAIGTDNFTIAGNIIFIDPGLVKEFEQKGTLKVSEQAKVEGKIIDNRKIAEEIKVFGNQQEVNIKIKQIPQQFKAKARGPLENLRDLLNQLLNLLKGRK